MTKVIEVFTDGSCMKKKCTLCGYGINFPNKELPNISRKFMRKPLTNQRAELFAIYVALVLIKKLLKYDKVKLYSDSEYSIKCSTIWIEKWKLNKWKTSDGKMVKNQDILKPLDSVLQKFKNKIEFIHVPSHTGKTDYNSVNNAIADHLATSGATS